MKLCPCGKPLHYTDPGVEREVAAVVEEKGEFQRVTVNGRTWLVSRHYIALHGLKGSEVASLGFQEVFDA
jgi:hypothetical protein